MQRLSYKEEQGKSFDLLFCLPLCFLCSLTVLLILRLLSIADIRNQFFQHSNVDWRLVALQELSSPGTSDWNEDASSLVYRVQSLLSESASEDCPNSILQVLVFNTNVIPSINYTNKPYLIQLFFLVPRLTLNLKGKNLCLPQEPLFAQKE